MKLVPQDFESTFGILKSFGSVSKVGINSSIDCVDITIQEYRDLCDIVLNEFGKENTEDRISELYEFKSFFNKALLSNCHFTPSSSWTKQDVLDWFELIGFTPQVLSKKYDSLLCGKAILHGNPLRLFSEEDWNDLVDKYREYTRRLENIRPIYLQKIED